MWGGLVESGPNWTFGAVDFVDSVVSVAAFVDPLVRVFIFFQTIVELDVDFDLHLISTCTVLYSMYGRFASEKTRFDASATPD
jgi:hypothetical protein